MKSRVLLSCLLFSFVSVSGQKSITHQSLYWIRYYPQLRLSSKYTLHAEIENRRFFKNSIQHHTINHYRLQYKLSSYADAGGGITFSWQSPQIPDGVNHLVVPEIRGVQELNLTQNISKVFSLGHRFRVDERFIHKNNGITLEDGYDFNFRFRYRVQILYKLTKSLRVKAGDEIMINQGKIIVYNTFDQNRVYFSLEKEFSPKVALEISYIKWYQQRPSGNQYFSRDILRFSFLHKLMWHGRSNNPDKF